MDITGIDVAGLIAGVSAFAKSFKEGRKNAENQQNLETEIAVLKKENESFRDNLEGGTKRFERIECKLDRLNDTIVSFSAKFSQYVELMAQRSDNGR